MGQSESRLWPFKIGMLLLLCSIGSFKLVFKLWKVVQLLNFQTPFKKLNLLVQCSNLNMWFLLSLYTISIWILGTHAWYSDVCILYFNPHCTFQNENLILGQSSVCFSDLPEIKMATLFVSGKRHALNIWYSTFLCLLKSC